MVFMGVGNFFAVTGGMVLNRKGCKERQKTKEKRKKKKDKRKKEKGYLIFDFFLLRINTTLFEWRAFNKPVTLSSVEGGHCRAVILKRTPAE